MIKYDLHGGNIYDHMTGPDFSVSLNPAGIPEAVRASVSEAVNGAGVSAYPEYENRALRRDMLDFLTYIEGRRSDRCPDLTTDNILAGNGASELLMTAVMVTAPRKAVVPVPSFYGYERALRAVGADVIFYPMRGEKGFCVDDGLLEVLSDDTDMLFLTNPNNPTGRLIDEGLLLKILEHCREREILVLMDESFLYFCEGSSGAIWKVDEPDNILVLGSFTKLFSIPGIRLGYMLGTDTALMERIGAALPEWNVSAISQQVGSACTKERDWVEKTLRKTKEERSFLEEGLERLAYSYPDAGLHIYPSDANFLMFYSSLPLYELFLKKQILIRDLSHIRGMGEGFYRIGVRSRRDNELFLKTAEEICESFG